MFSPFSLPNDLSLAILWKVQFIKSSKQWGHSGTATPFPQPSHRKWKKKSGSVQISARVKKKNAGTITSIRTVKSWRTELNSLDLLSYKHQMRRELKFGTSGLHVCSYSWGYLSLLSNKFCQSVIGFSLCIKTYLLVFGVHPHTRCNKIEKMHLHSL